MYQPKVQQVYRMIWSIDLLTKRQFFFFFSCTGEGDGRELVPRGDLISTRLFLPLNHNRRGHLTILHLLPTSVTSVTAKVS